MPTEYYFNIKTPMGRLMNIINDTLDHLDQLTVQEKLKHASDIKALGTLLLQCEKRNWQNANFQDYDRMTTAELQQKLEGALKVIKKQPKVTAPPKQRRLVTRERTSDDAASAHFTERKTELAQLAQPSTSEAVDPPDEPFPEFEE